jgi:hypothetical protein
MRNFLKQSESIKCHLDPLGGMPSRVALLGSFLTRRQIEFSRKRSVEVAVQRDPVPIHVGK